MSLSVSVMRCILLENSIKEYSTAMAQVLGIAV